MDDTREERVAAVRAELAKLEEADRTVELPRRHRRTLTAPSVVYSIRLDPAEVAALESRATQADMKPTALARNLIRTGLAAPRGDALPRAIDQLQASVDELRSLC